MINQINLNGGGVEPTHSSNSVPNSSALTSSSSVLTSASSVSVYGGVLSPASVADALSSMRSPLLVESHLGNLEPLNRNLSIATKYNHQAELPIRTKVQWQSLEDAKLRDRWAISYNAGWRRVGVPSSEVRQEAMDLQFGSRRNSVLIASYGHRTAMPLNKRDTGVRTHHKDSTLYFRDSHANINYLLRNVIERATSQGLLDTTNADNVRVKLVGSEAFQDKLKRLFPGFETNYLAEPPKVVKLSSGLYAVVYKFDSTYDAAFYQSIEQSMTRIHYILGATPAYQSIAKYLSLAPNQFGDVRGAKRSLTRSIDTRSIDQFNALQPALNQLAEASKEFSSDTRAIAELSVALVTRFPSRLFWFNEAIMNDGLRQIGNLIVGLSVSQHDFVGSVQLYDLLIDEISLILNTIRPYSDDTIHTEQQQIYSNELPSVKKMRGVRIQSLATSSSGMGAVSTALSEARAQFQRVGIDLLKVNMNYFEVDEILYLSGLHTEGQPVIMTTLNPSLPIKASNIDEIITKTKETLNLYKGKNVPVYLVIDTTMNTGDSKLDQLISQLQDPIERGAINIVLCKSLQKYDSLGTGKIMAGNITTINNGADHYRNFEHGILSTHRKENIFEHNNGQLLAHLLKCHDQSLSIMQKAIDGAKFVNDFCWPEMKMEEGSGHIDGLPFVMRYDLPILTAVDYLADCGTDKRDTFGFIESSVCPINGSNQAKNWLLRINPGLDTPEQLVERFFCIGHLFGSTFTDNMDEMLIGLDHVCSSMGKKVVKSLLEKSPEDIVGIDDLVLSSIARELGFPFNEVCRIVDGFQCLKGASKLSDRQQFDLLIQYEANIKASIIKGMSVLGKDSFVRHADDFIANEFRVSAHVAEEATIGAVTLSSREFILSHRLNQLIKSPETIDILALEKIVAEVPMRVKLDVLLKKIPDSFFDESNPAVSSDLRLGMIDHLCEGVPFTELVGIGKLSLMMGDSIHKANAIVRVLESRGLLQTEAPDFFREDLINRSLSDSPLSNQVDHQAELGFLRGMISTFSLFPKQTSF